MLNEAQVFKNKKKAKYSNRYHRRVNILKIYFHFFEEDSFKEQVDLKNGRGHTSSEKPSSK